MYVYRWKYKYSGELWYVFKDMYTRNKSEFFDARKTKAKGA